MVPKLRFCAAAIRRDNMNRMQEIRRELEQIAEADYKKFSASLIPGEEHLLGVRLPKLREIAKRIAKTDAWQEYLADEPYYFEETMLQGMLIGAVNISVEERFDYMRAFIPKIHNWSVCDSFASGLKFTKKYPEQVWGFIQPYVRSDEEFSIRFAVVMMMDYYLTDAYIDFVLECLDGINHDAYYVKMAVAWALATALAKQPEKTWAYLQKHHLDDDTWKKTVQKCIESYRISEEHKTVLREMRRDMLKHKNV